MSFHLVGEDLEVILHFFASPGSGQDTNTSTSSPTAIRNHLSHIFNHMIDYLHQMIYAAPLTVDEMHLNHGREYRIIQSGPYSRSH